MKIVYISASNVQHTNDMSSTSLRICTEVKGHIHTLFPDSAHQVIQLRKMHILPCSGCGGCFNRHRCIEHDDFNYIYEQIINADLLVLVSPHYAPIPAKLAALLEKMEQITFLHWGRDTTYKSEVSHVQSLVISHGGGSDWALKEYKRMVNDTIANALSTIQINLIPFSEEWSTGISLPVKKAVFREDQVFPDQAYDWNQLSQQLKAYTKKALDQI